MTQNIIQTQHLTSVASWAGRRRQARGGEPGQVRAPAPGHLHGRHGQRGLSLRDGALLPAGRLRAPLQRLQAGGAGGPGGRVQGRDPERAAEDRRPEHGADAVPAARGDRGDLAKQTNTLN